MEREAATKKELIEDLEDLRQQPADMKKSRSETKNSLQALQASETRYRRLFEAAQDGILILNADTGEIDDVNPYMIDMLHYSREEFLGMKLWEVSPFKDKVFNQAAFEELQDKGYIQYKDLPLETKEGKPIAVEFVSNVYKANGNKVIQCNIRNITERKEMNRKLQEAVIFQQRLIDALPVPVFYKDSEGRYLGCNSSFEELFGQKREQITGKSVYDLSPKEFADIYHEKDLALLQNPGIQIYESVVKDADGVVHNVIFHKATFSNMDGSVGGLIGAILDITDRKRAEAALLAKNEELNSVLQQLLQAAKLATMGELASSIAHELNNPLATVSLRTESLTAQTAQDDPRRRELEIIGHEVERMGNLVTNLLQFSRRSQKQISTVDIREEIEKTLELIHYHLRKNNIQVIREFAPDVPVILADRQQLRQLFLNLFTNASDAMPKGGTLTIRVAAQPEGKKISIEIADTGTGISPEILPKVMEPFYTTKPEGKGTGLGLAICRRIAQEHQGTFDIASEGIPGKGTIVRITLSSTESRAIQSV